MRSLLRSIFTVLVLPFVGWYVLTGRRRNGFRSLLQLFCFLPGRIGSGLRAALLRGTAAHCGSDLTIELGTLFSDPQVELGKNVYIGAFCNIGWAKIEDYVLLGSNVHIISGKHVHDFDRTDIPIALQGGSRTQVTVGYGAWVGNGAILMADVGAECVIGAGSVVVQPVPAWSIAVGSPARVVGSRRPESASETASA